MTHHFRDDFNQIMSGFGPVSDPYVSLPRVLCDGTEILVDRVAGSRLHSSLAAIEQANYAPEIYSGSPISARQVQLMEIAQEYLRSPQSAVQIGSNILVSGTGLFLSVDESSAKGSNDEAIFDQHIVGKFSGPVYTRFRSASQEVIRQAIGDEGIDADVLNANIRDHFGLGIILEGAAVYDSEYLGPLYCHLPEVLIPVTGSTFLIQEAFELTPGQ